MTLDLLWAAARHQSVSVQGADRVRRAYLSHRSAGHRISAKVRCHCVFSSVSPSDRIYSRPADGRSDLDNTFTMRAATYCVPLVGLFATVLSAPLLHVVDRSQPALEAEADNSIGILKREMPDVNMEANNPTHIAERTAAAPNVEVEAQPPVSILDRDSKVIDRDSAIVEIRT